jgi:hypothetical protein
MKNSMNIDDIKTFIESNKDDEKVNKFVKSLTDQAVSRGCATFEKNFMENKLPVIIKEKLEGNPLEKREAELNIKIRATEVAAETGIPYKVVLRQLTGDPEADSAAVQDLQELISQAKIAKASEMQMKGSFKPQDSNSQSFQFTVDDLKKMPPSEVVSLTKKGMLNHLLRRS